MKKNKARRKSVSNIVKVEILMLLLIVSTFILFFLQEKSKYENYFFRGTVINGVDCSLLTVEEAKIQIEIKEEEYALEIAFKDNKVEKITGAEICYTVSNLQEKLEDIKKQQERSISLKGKTYSFNDFSYDEGKLTATLASKEELKTPYMAEKTNISYTFDSSSKRFKVKEQDSYYLDFDEVFKRVSKAIQNKESKTSVEDLYSMPDKNEELDKINSLISAEITYTLPNGDELVLDAGTLHTWLVQNEEGMYIKDEEVWNQNIEQFIEELSLLVDDTGKKREFKPTGKTEKILLERGDYGYLLDKEEEANQLKTELQQQQIIIREPCYLKKEVSKDNFGIGESYVEIDLTRQKVWVYVDGEIQIQTDCVTGCINKGHETPTGIYTLTYKQEDRVLRGPGYASPVSYWMPFNGGIGLHDATWRSSFGGDIYVSNGSHGCINLPLEAARKLYNIINYDMPIIVYKS